MDDPNIAQNPQAEAIGAAINQADAIRRDKPDPAEARAALVTEWRTRVDHARAFWEQRAFRAMRQDMEFAAGKQWQQSTGAKLADDARLHDAVDQRYVANITLRHIQARTASLYGKNPKVIARRKPRLLSQIWDGTNHSYMLALAGLQANPADPMLAAVVQEANMVLQANAQATKLARTLELLFEHEISEQEVPFKSQMKALVRRSLTTGVGYVKLGYQRIVGMPPEVDAQIADYERQLSTVEQLASDMEAGEFTDTDAKAEELNQAISALAKTKQIVLREGLMFTYPHSTAVIPDPNCQQLRGWVGCDWVAEEYFLTADKIKQIYNVDVKAAGGGTGSTTDGVTAREYMRGQNGVFSTNNDTATKDTADAFFCVWEIYSRSDGQVYTICDGYRDFLVEPSPPDVKLERFFPWFPFVVNETYSEGAVFPPSDVRLMRDMQMELNRSRQSLREHRRAALPRTVSRKGVLSEADKATLADPVALTNIELEALDPNTKIQDVIQPLNGPTLDPRLYDTTPAYEDYLRTLGQQEANLGGTSGATATEASIAEGSRVSTASAVVDDLDEFLSDFSRAAGQVLLMECSADKVRKVVGAGAVWPELSHEDVMSEIYLDVEAASTGRPNRAQEVQTAQAIFPLLMQVPNINPEFLAENLLRRMDDRLDLQDAFMPNTPSIMAMNRGGGGMGGAPNGAAPQDDPNAQGPQGGDNAPRTEPPQVNVAPRPPNAVGRPPMVPLPPSA